MSKDQSSQSDKKDNSALIGRAKAANAVVENLPKEQTSNKIRISGANTAKNVLGRMSYEPDPISRRLDSIARVIVGDNVCAAVAFDGRKILVANNQNNYDQLTVEFFDFLKNVAESNIKISEMNSSEKLQEDIDKFVAKAIAQHKKNRFTKGETALYDNKISNDIHKIVHSLATDCEEEKKFPEQLRNAITKRIDFVSGMKVNIEDKSTGKLEVREILVHAEMAILDKLLADDKNIIESNKSLYVGITKLCCKDCFATIKALNYCAQQKRGEGDQEPLMKLDPDLLVKIRGTHLMKFPWGEPKFLESIPGVRSKYNELIKNTIFHPAPSQLADRSDSEPETSLAEGSKANLKKTNSLGESSARMPILDNESNRSSAIMIQKMIRGFMVRKKYSRNLLEYNMAPPPTPSVGISSLTISKN